MDEERENKQPEIYEEEPRLKPWMRAVACVLVLCMFYQGIISSIGPDLESTMSLQFQKLAPRASQPLNLTSLGSIFKALFIQEACAESNDLITKPNSSAASANSAGVDTSYPTAAAPSAYFTGEKVSTPAAGSSVPGVKTVRPPTSQAPAYSWYTSPTGGVSQYKTQETNGVAGVTYIPGPPRTKKGVLSDPELVSLPPIAGGKQAVTQPVNVPKYYAKPGLTKTVSGADVASARAKVDIRLGGPKPNQAVMVSKGMLAAKASIASQINLSRKISTQMAMPSIIRRAQSSQIHFTRSRSGNNFYRLPAITAIKAFNYNNIAKHISAPAKVFVSLPNITRPTMLTNYASLNRNLVQPLPPKKDNSQQPNNPLPTKQPLLPPVAPVNAPQPPADNPTPGPGTGNGPGTGTGSASGNAGTGGSGNHTGSIVSYGHAPVIIHLPGFPTAGKYEIVLSTLAQLYGEKLASVRGDGGVILPSSGIMPSPEAGRNREGGNLTVSILIPCELALPLSGQTLESVIHESSDNRAFKTHPDTGVLFAFNTLPQAFDPIYIGNIYHTSSKIDSISAINSNNQENNLTGGKPFRRGLGPILPAQVNSGVTTPASGFLTLKSDAGVLPQSLVNTLGITQFVQYMGVK